VAEAICEKYTDKPDFCNEIEGKYHSIFDVNSQTHYFAVFVIILVMVLVLLGMLYCYKRMMRREMTKEMNIQISQMQSLGYTLFYESWNYRIFIRLNKRKETQ
jgi:Na+/proline symporter